MGYELGTLFDSSNLMVKETDSFQDPIIKLNLTFHISTDRFEPNLLDKFDSDPNPVVVTGFPIVFSIEFDHKCTVRLLRGSRSKTIHIEDECTVVLGNLNLCLLRMLDGRDETTDCRFIANNCIVLIDLDVWPLLDNTRDELDHGQWSSACLQQVADRRHSWIT